MACGCQQGQKTSTTGYSNSGKDLPGYDEQLADIIDGDRKLTLLDALQMIAAVATIAGFLKYLFRSK